MNGNTSQYPVEERVLTKISLLTTTIPSSEHRASSRRCIGYSLMGSQMKQELEYCRHLANSKECHACFYVCLSAAKPKTNKRTPMLHNSHRFATIDALHHAMLRKTTTYAYSYSHNNCTQDPDVTPRS